MARMIKINFRNKEEFEVEVDTPVYKISEKVQKYFNFPIMVAKIDNEIVGLNSLLTKKCNIDFFDRSDATGNDVYSHSVHMMMVLAFRRVLGKETEVHIQNSIDNGVCCEVFNHKLSKELLNTITKEMNHIVKQDLIFTTINVNRIDAIKFFKKEGRMDKVSVLKYISNSYISLDRLDDVYDYYFSKLAYSTKDIPDFKLTYIDNNNFVLSIPSIYNPECTLDYKHVPLVFNTFNNYDKWLSKINIRNAADLNGFVSAGNAKDVIRMSEINYENQLKEIADKIYENKDTVKLVLLAGPSSSGKTTSAKKLSLYLRTKGFNTITLSTDDYFLERVETPKDENGEYDFESINAIDLKLFNSQLAKILKGQKVLTPEYNFVEGKKEYRKRWVQMSENDIIVIEGLHCLNEQLTSSISRKEKFKIFIGPFTQLNIDNHNRIHTSDTRRLRRIIRDNRTRGYSAADTLKMWGKIREGEVKWIFPYENDADAIINSALLYELGVLKTYVEPLLFSVEEDDPMYPEAIRLINFLRNLLPIPSDDIPHDSILREFIGGSGFYND